MGAENALSPYLCSASQVPGPEISGLITANFKYNENYTTSDDYEGAGDGGFLPSSQCGLPFRYCHCVLVSTPTHGHVSMDAHQWHCQYLLLASPPLLEGHILIFPLSARRVPKSLDRPISTGFLDRLNSLRPSAAPLSPSGPSPGLSGGRWQLIGTGVGISAPLAERQPHPSSWALAFASFGFAMGIIICSGPLAFDTSS